MLPLSSNPIIMRVALAACGFASLFVVPSHASVVAYQKVVTTVDKSINENPGYQSVVVCSAGPFTVLAGDVVTAHSQEEVTWSGSTRVMTAGGIVVATSPTAVDSTSPGYIGMLAKFAGNNLDKAKEDTEVMTRTGSYQFTSGYSTVYINSIAYGQTLPQYTPGANAVIPADFGEIVVTVERDIERYATSAYQQIPFDGGTGHYYIPSAGSFTPYVQYAYGPLNIAAGSMVDVRFQVEGSTPVDEGNSIVERLGRKVIQTTSPTSTSGNFLIQSIQGGATEEEHHATFETGGGMYFPSAVNGAYFNSALWCYGTASKIQIETESSTQYGGFAVEVRPYAGFWKDTTSNLTTLSGTQQVLYSVGPIDIPADQLVEVRYQAAFAPSSRVKFASKIVRATSPTATTGTEIQRPLYCYFDPSYVYTNSIHSTAERPATAANGQYYNVVAWLPTTGGSLPVEDWGQLEVIFREQ